ncbi:MAG TPA: hypothetical protein VNI01_12125 [Elusimicrobiota bacterium]|nr:hypothetical protein [Elusimicrobiota bacterium]
MQLIRRAALLAVLPACALAAQPSDAGSLLRQAAIDSHPALLNTYLLTMSAQANLLDLKWGLGRWGLAERKAQAASHYERYSAELTDFLKAAEAADAATNPFEAEIQELAKSDRVRAAAAATPESPSAQVADVRRMRAENYDGEGSRAAFIRARGALARLETLLGPSALSPAQTAALEKAQGLLKDLRAIIGDLSALPPSEGDKTGAAKAGRRAVGDDLRLLRKDSAELESSIAGLALYFRVNNLQAGKTAMRDAVSSAGKADDAVHDPDLVSELAKAQAGNADAAMNRSMKEASAAMDAFAALTPPARAHLAAATAAVRKAARISASGADPDMQRALEDGADALVLAGQSLDVKIKLLSEKASAAGAAAPSDADAARASYRDADRARDLRKAEEQLLQVRAQLPKGSRPVALSAEQGAAVAAAQDLVAELRSARSTVADLSAQIAQSGRPDLSASTRAIDAVGLRLEADAAPLSREARLLEIAFLMDRCSQAAFDRAK